MQTSYRNCVLPAFALLVLFASGLSESASTNAAARAGTSPDASATTRVSVSKDDPEVMLGPGLRANKKHRYVDLAAKATGATSTTSLDALIVSEGADASRAVAVAEATPDEVQAALEFIGMAAGHPIDGASGHYWPKGERVIITLYWDDPEAQRFNQSVRFEHLLTDVAAKTRLPELGFRFVGFAEGLAAADADGYIVTAFNAQNTILEIPYIADRRIVSGRLVASDDYQFAAGKDLRIRIRPEFRGSRKRVHDLLVDVSSGTGPDADHLSELDVLLQTQDGAALHSGTFESTLVQLEKMVDAGSEPFLQLRFSDSLPISSVQAVARLLHELESEKDVRVEANEAHLFYRAFLPNDAWRNPARRNRASQPLEIHLDEESPAAGFRGRLIHYPQSSDASAKRRSFDGFDNLQEAIREGAPWQTQGAFLFVSPDLKYGDIRKVYEIIRKDFPIVYVFT